MPQRWVQAMGAEQMNIVFSARNLYTWTGYSGLAPEVTYNNGNFIRQDFVAQQPVTTFVTRINLTF